MRILVAALAVGAALAVAGCQTNSAANFFGTADRCQQAEVMYSSFLAYAAANGGVSAEAKRKAATGLAAVREQCADGKIDNVTLNKLIRAYAAAIEQYRKGAL